MYTILGNPFYWLLILVVVGVLFLIKDSQMFIYLIPVVILMVIGLMSISKESDFLSSLKFQNTGKELFFSSSNKYNKITNIVLIVSSILLALKLAKIIYDHKNPYQSIEKINQQIANELDGYNNSLLPLSDLLTYLIGSFDFIRILGNTNEEKMNLKKILMHRIKKKMELAKQMSPNEEVNLKVYFELSITQNNKHKIRNVLDDLLLPISFTSMMPQEFIMIYDYGYPYVRDLYYDAFHYGYLDYNYFYPHYNYYKKNRHTLKLDKAQVKKIDELLEQLKCLTEQNKSVDKSSNLDLSKCSKEFQVDFNKFENEIKSQEVINKNLLETEPLKQLQISSEDLEQQVSRVLENNSLTVDKLLKKGLPKLDTKVSLSNITKTNSAIDQQLNQNDDISSTLVEVGDQDQIINNAPLSNVQAFNDDEEDANYPNMINNNMNPDTIMRFKDTVYPNKLINMENTKKVFSKLPSSHNQQPLNLPRYDGDRLANDLGLVDTTKFTNLDVKTTSDFPVNQQNNLKQLVPDKNIWTSNNMDDNMNQLNTVDDNPGSKPLIVQSNIKGLSNIFAPTVSQVNNVSGQETQLDFNTGLNTMEKSLNGQLNSLNNQMNNSLNAPNLNDTGMNESIETDFVKNDIKMAN